MNFPKTAFLLACVSLSLAGCASVDRSYGLAEEVEVSDLETLPAPKSARIYRLGPQEVIEIAVVGSEELSGTFLTNELGNLDYPLLGTLPVEGLSPSEASRMIEDGLRGDYLRNPQVRLIPVELPPASVSVGGQVLKPGDVPASGKLTLLRAVNQAGGLSEYAQLDDVLVLRSVNGQNYIGLYSIGAIQRGNYPDPELYADDIVIVGDSPQRRQLDRILAIAAPIISSTAVILNQVAR